MNGVISRPPSGRATSWKVISMIRFANSPTRFLVVAATIFALIALLSIVGAGTAAAAAPNPPNCMGKDMGFWAREGSIAGVTGDATFDSGSGWGRFVAQTAQSEDPFGEDNWGQAMVAHLAGLFWGVPGVTCQPPA